MRGHNNGFGVANEEKQKKTMAGKLAPPPLASPKARTLHDCQGSRAQNGRLLHLHTVQQGRKRVSGWLQRLLSVLKQSVHLDTHQAMVGRVSEHGRADTHTHTHGAVPNKQPQQPTSRELLTTAGSAPAVAVGPTTTKGASAKGVQPPT
jgi:hypothetical protein